MKKIVITFSSLFILLALLVAFGFTSNFDHTIYQFFVDKSTDTTMLISQFLSFFASVKGLIVVCLLLLFILPDNKKREYSILTLIGSALLIVISKNIFVRARPLIGQQLLTDYSFPSGHSFAATAFYGLLIYYIQKSRLSKEKKMVYSILLEVFIIVIALSRIVMGVHFLTDIVGGILFGLIFLLFVIYLFEKDNLKRIKEKSLAQSFKYAIDGIVNTFKKERNMVIHLFVMALVITAGIIYHISIIEWLICLLLFGMIFALELINTAVENSVDLVTKEKKEKARLAKDAAAGAVLVMSIFAAIIGIIIFLPKFLG